MNLVRLFSLTMLAACASAQGIYIVDSRNGPGTHFTDLPAAIAAVPDGAVLSVRAGAYATFTLQGKGLTITGVDRDTVFIANPGPPLAVKNTSAKQAVLLQNFTIAATTVAQIDLHNLAGPIVLDNVTVMNASIFATWMDIANCANVELHQCDFGSGVQGVFAGGPPVLDVKDSTLQVSFSRVMAVGSVSWGVAGGTAINLVRSRCLAFAARITGGDGGQGCIATGGCLIMPGEGGKAIAAASSTFLSLGSWISGGRGRATYTQQGSSGGTWGAPFGDGGDGMLITSGSLAQCAGFSPLGGPAGGAGATPGAGAIVNNGGSLQLDPAAVPTAATITGTPGRQKVVRFDCVALPGSAAILLMSYDATLLPLEPMLPGSLLANAVLIAGPAIVPAGGTLALPYLVPPIWPLGLTTFGQFVTIEPSGARSWVSNSFPMHVSS